MSDLGIHGWGSTLAGSTVGTIGQILKISIPTVEADAIDISTMDSTDKWQSFIPGMINAGQLDVDLAYYKTDAKIILDEIGGTVETWTITLNDETSVLTSPSTFACSGYIKGVGNAIPFEDKVTSTITIKLSGAPTFTARHA